MKRYLKYAIGEVFLVVIGILIAVSLNNWNENRKTNNRLKTILEMVKTDLIKDSLSSYYSIKYYKSQDSIAKILVSDTVSKEYLKKNRSSTSIPFTNIPFKMSDGSINLLKNESYNLAVATDTIIRTIIGFHDMYEASFKDIDEKIKKDVQDNTAHMKTFDSHAVDIFNKNIPDDYYTYFLSEDFKNRVVMHRQLTGNNAVKLMENFNLSVKNMIPYIDQRIAE